MIKIFHTPGSFGNYLAFLIDSKNNGKLLDDPFTASGSSHNREKTTRSYDIVLSNAYDNFKECTNNDIGIYWPTEYFFYILHSAYGRTNNGQYGICGVKALQDNTWQWFNQHQGHGQPGNSLSMFLDGLKTFYGVVCDKDNQIVPKNVLRYYFFFHFVKYFKNKLYIKNNEIQQNNVVKKISIETILDYEKLKKYLDISFNFEEIHTKFLRYNQSLRAYHQQQVITNAVKNNKALEINDIDIITEAGIFFELEKYYYDIPFHNLEFNFTNTQQLIDYIKQFPQYMKRPNNLFLEHWRIYNVK
jgi:hypothetical protein